MDRVLLMKQVLAVILILCLWIFPAVTWAVPKTYCPNGHGFIQAGMSQSDVLSACGQPNNKTLSSKPATEKVPVQQLIYTTLNPTNQYPGLTNAFYKQWSLPEGSNDTFNLVVDVMENKITAIRLNGNNSNRMSMCTNSAFQVGDEVSKVYAACGSPETINATFKNVVIPSKNRPEVWTYQVDQYQPSFRLTFVNGRLESID
jgi:hypothetical protein